MVFKLPAPLWFDLVDLTFAYFPMAYLGSWIINKYKKVTIK